VSSTACFQLIIKAGAKQIFIHSDFLAFFFLRRPPSPSDSDEELEEDDLSPLFFSFFFFFFFLPPLPFLRQEPSAYSFVPGTRS